MVKGKLHFLLPLFFILFVVYRSYQPVFSVFNRPDIVEMYPLDQGLLAKQPLVFYQPIVLNQASVSLLTQLPGLGPQLAGRIVAYRTAHGPFSDLNELSRVNGIGPKKLAKIRPYVVLDRK